SRRSSPRRLASRARSARPARARSSTGGSTSASWTPSAPRRRSSRRPRRATAERVIVELIEDGLDAREREKKEFFELAERLARSPDPIEQQRLKEELARMTFGS